MAVLETHRAVVLKVSRTGESGKALDLLLESGGIVQCVARGASRSKRRFSGCLEPFTSATFNLRRGRGRPAIESVDDVQSRFGISRSVEALAAASCVAEWVLLASRGGGRGKDVMEIVEAALSLLAIHGAYPDTIMLGFETGLLALMGWLPDMECCPVCGKDLGRGRGVAFSKEDRVFLHETHGGNGLRMDAVTWALARRFGESNLATCATIRLEGLKREKLAELLGMIATCSIGRLPASRKMALDIFSVATDS